jgi:hypothetical protein
MELKTITAAGVIGLVLLAGCARNMEKRTPQGVLNCEHKALDWRVAFDADADTTEFWFDPIEPKIKFVDLETGDELMIGFRRNWRCQPS